jgi:hypothetical protein
MLPAIDSPSEFDAVDIPVVVHLHTVHSMDQISIKTPNPKCRLFLKIYQERYLAAGVYLSEAPDPLPPTPSYTLYEYIPLYIFTQGRGRGGV